jgi:hypothetical protein
MEPTKDQKIIAWQFMKKHALPRMKEAERKKRIESENHEGSRPREKEE